MGRAQHFLNLSKNIASKSLACEALAACVFLIVFASHCHSHIRNHNLISYVIRVDLTDLSGYGVEMRVQHSNGAVRIAMASHPEYDDRYWRYVENLTAESRGIALKVTHEEDTLWRVDGVGGELTVRYRIRLPQQITAIRAGWKPFLSPTGGLVGDLHSLMYVVGSESAPARMTLEIPKDWAIASGLDSTNDPRTFTASSVEILLDSPIAVGKLSTWDFVVNGVPHHVVYLPQPDTKAFDSVAFVAGIQGIANEAIKIFGKTPYRNYTFIYLDGASGGLEHLNSVTWGANSQSLEQGLAEIFQVTAHEFFHTWNLMHVRPVERVGLHYSHTEPTSVLWWSEGVTMYFADLLLRRAKLQASDPTMAAYLEHNISDYLLTPGYSRISPEHASRASDDPLGLGDDFASYYLQGQLLGAVLDLMTREATHGRRTLDNVMRKLSDRFTPERGITGSDIESAAHDVCGCYTHSFFEAHVRGSQSIDFNRYLRIIGLRAHISWAPALNIDGTPAPDLRVFLFNTATDPELRLRLLDPASVWGRAGLRTGDRLVSVDGRPVTSATDFRNWMRQLNVGQTARIEVERNGAVLQLAVAVNGYNRPTVKIDEIPDATPEQRRLRAQWVAAAP
jgi:predicted metalloprotease with PDZ domain